MVNLAQARWLFTCYGSAHKLKHCRDMFELHASHLYMRKRTHTYTQTNELALRLVAGWEVKGRWPHIRHRSVFAWMLAGEMRHRVTFWLANDNQPCATIDCLWRQYPYIKNYSGQAATQWWFCKTFRASTFEHANHNKLLLIAVDAELFNPMQRDMLDDCFKRETNLIKELDPSRSSIRNTGTPHA